MCQEKKGLENNDQDQILFLEQRSHVRTVNRFLCEDIDYDLFI